MFISPARFNIRQQALARFILIPVFMALMVLSGMASGARAELFLWKSDSNEPLIYIMGSVHALTPQDYPLPAPYQRAYEQTDKLVLEVDLSGESMSRASALMFELAALPGDRTLEDILGGKKFEKLNNKALDNGLSLEMMNAFEPWFASLMVSQALFMKGGLRPELGVDKHFEERARADGKTIGQLETVRDQLLIFDELPMKLQVAFLETAIDDFAEGSDMLNTLMEAWRSGDDAVLADVMNEEIRKYPGLARSLLDKRNKKWAEKITGYFNEKANILVIVGAGHLVGEANLIALLEQKGHGFSRVPRPDSP